MNLLRRLSSAVVLMLLSAGAVLVGTALPAAAHATLVDVTPTAGSVVQAAPRSLRLRFSEPVQVTDGSVSVIGPDGRPLGDVFARTDPADGSVLIVGLRGDLPDGTYNVAWRVVSLDTHPVQGTFAFAVGSPSSPLAQAGSTASVGPSLLGGAARAAAVAGALCITGLAAFPVLVLGPARRRLRTRSASDWTALSTATTHRLRLPLVLAGAVALAGTCGVLVDTASGSGASVLETSTGTRAGQLLLVRVVAVVVTVVVCTLPLSRAPGIRRLSVAMTGSALTLATFSLSSHAAASVADRPVAVSFDLAHLLAAGVWTGGLLGLAVAAMPAAAAAAGDDSTRLGESASALAASFSVVAQLAMIGVLVTGVYAVLLQVSDFVHLGQTAWGFTLIAKLALWASVLLFATANAFTFVPALAGRAGAAVRRLAALGQLRSASRIEIGLAAALIVVAAVMSATEQPEQQLAADAQSAAVNNVEVTRARARSDGYVARIRTSRTGIGDAASTVFEVGLRTKGTFTTLPRARAVLTADGGIRRPVPLQFVDVGRWSSALLPIAPGQYRLTTTFGGREQALTFPIAVEVPAPPRAVIVAAQGNSDADARERARTALLAALAANAVLAGLAVAGLRLRRTRRTAPTELREAPSSTARDQREYAPR